MTRTVASRTFPTNGKDEEEVFFTTVRFPTLTFTRYFFQRTDVHSSTQIIDIANIMYMYIYIYFFFDNKFIRDYGNWKYIRHEIPREGDGAKGEGDPIKYGNIFTAA